MRGGGGGGRDEWQRLAKLRKVAGCENGSWGQDSALNHGGEALPADRQPDTGCWRPSGVKEASGRQSGVGCQPRQGEGLPWEVARRSPAVEKNVSGRRRQQVGTRIGEKVHILHSIVIKINTNFLISIIVM